MTLERDLPPHRSSVGPDPSGTAGVVLCIEDNPIITMLIERILATRPGVVFDSAPTGRTGMDRAVHLQPDLIILDLELPDMNGGQVLAHVRANPATRAIPVVVVSADLDPAVHHRLLGQGARSILTKPFDVTELLSLVDGVLGSGGR